MNEIMKTLTIVSATFIPYCRCLWNEFSTICPELEYKKMAIMSLDMVVIGIIMVFYFRKRKWF
jgi:magnesium transporter